MATIVQAIRLALHYGETHLGVTDVFAEYAFNIIDLLKVAGNQRWASAGAFDMPIVMMTPTGAGIRGSMYHSHSYESFASRLPGWKVVMPSNPLDAYGLMLSAIVDPNPVMVLLPKALLRAKAEELIPGEPTDPAELSRRIDDPIGDRSNWEPDWPAVDEYYVPIGLGSLVREGETATVLSYGRTLPLCAQAADELKQSDGLSFDVIDLRSI